MRCGAVPVQSGGDIKGPRRWRRELVEAMGFGPVADRLVGGWATRRAA